MNHATIASENLLEAQQHLITIKDWMRWCASSFERLDVYFGHGTDNPWDESVALVLQALSLPFDTPDALFDARVTPSEAKRICEFIEQRINDRKPLAYITQQAFFCGLPFYVDERVLVPRSPIAELIESRFEPFIDPENVHAILDLCTGSGCIAIALAHYFPDAFVTATDLSMDALQVAQFNIEQHQLDDQVCLLQSDVFDAIPEQRFDVIVSNPPYVDAEDMADLPEEFHVEPELGLASGEDGLDVTRRILAKAADYLSDDGILIVEVGNSWPALEEAYPTVEFQWIEFARGGDGVFILTKEQLDSLRSE